jgi:hypothetical protein
MKNYYKILGLPEDSSQEDIQEAYERLSKELDPINNDNQEFFIKEYKKLQDAYKALSNSTILKSSEKSYVKTNLELAAQEELPKSTNDSITITISPEKIEELKRNAQENILSIDFKKVSLTFKIFCILCIIWSSFIILSVFGSFLFIMLEQVMNTIEILLWSLIFASLCWCNILTFDGAYKMYNGKINGYKIFFKGNITFIIILLFTIISNYIFSLNNKGLIVYLVLIFVLSIFGLIFKYFKKELSN